MTTNAATAGAMVMWITLDYVVSGRSSPLGACLGSVVGLVGITPAAGYVSVGSSIFIGAATALICFWSMQLMDRLQFVDDTLDVFAGYVYLPWSARDVCVVSTATILAIEYASRRFLALACVLWTAVLSLPCTFVLTYRLLVPVTVRWCLDLATCHRDRGCNRSCICAGHCVPH